MKNKYILLFLLGLAVLFLTVSCKSTPAEEAPVTPPEGIQDPNNVPPDQALLKALDDAVTRTGNARQLVIDFHGPEYFPSDWQSAEALNTQAGQQKRSGTVAETRDSTDRYKKAADAYDALAEKTLPQYHENKENELVDARNAVIRMEELLPDFLSAADNTALDAEAKYQAKDYYPAKDAATDALTMYSLLKAGLDSYALREEIAENALEAYDPANIEAADTTLESAAYDYQDKKFDSSKSKIDEATLSYSQALETGWESLAAENGASASAKRQQALDLKANVAVKDDFNSAQAVFTNANAAFQAQKHKEAAQLFGDSSSKFDPVIQAAMQKRQAAEDALVKANQKMAESDEAAKNAEKILEGGTQ